MRTCADEWADQDRREAELKAEVKKHFDSLAEIYEELDTRDLRSETQDLFGNHLTKLVDCWGGGLRLNLFTYSDYRYHSCGSDGSTSQLLTFLSEEEVKKHMKKFAQENKGTYCHHKFLSSMSDYGLYANSEYGGDFSGGLLGSQISLDDIGEKDIYGSETYSQIVAAREEVERQKRAKAEEEQRIRQDRIEHEQYERLKRKFENT